MKDSRDSGADFCGFFERFNLPAFSQGFLDKLVLLALVFFMSDVSSPIAPKAGRQLHPVWALPRTPPGCNEQGELLRYPCNECG